MRLTQKTRERLLTLRTLMMDERAKSRMRAALDAYVDLHELQKPIAARTPVRSPFFSYNPFSGVLAFVLILLVGGGGAAYAAEGSVPGSPLYPVKVSVIEPVQGALITSAQGQASWHANLASRRLEEATTLAATNKLDPQAQEYLQTKFNTEVDTSNEDADALAATGNTDAALDVRSDLEARITAHAEILAVITNHLETTATSTNPTLAGTKTLLAAVQQRQQQITEARLALEGTTDASGSGVAATLARAEVTTGAVVSEAKAQDDTAVAPVVARLTAAKTALTMARQAKSNATISSDDAHAAERSSEVASILLQHASLLRAFAPAATTTASTTATTTENKSGKDATSTDDKSSSGKSD